MAFFLNLTNHPVRAWSPEQVEAAKALGFDRVVDLDGGMPVVPPTASTGEVFRLAQDIMRRVDGMCPDDEYGDLGFAVQGEPTLTAALVRLIEGTEYRMSAGIAYAATTDRAAVETVGADGTVTKTSVFKFVQWRAY